MDGKSKIVEGAIRRGHRSLCEKVKNRKHHAASQQFRE